MSDVVGKLWGFCNTLRHDGVDYGDYIEQLTYLLFLKMADEKGAEIPKEYSWKILKEKSGTNLTDFYVDALRGLGKQKGVLGDIYGGAISRFSNPVNLKHLINLIDEIEWTSLNVDVKAAAYEGLLEKSASEGKKGAGQFFTPRILIKSIVHCMKPDPIKIKDFTVHDPAAGTGGFLVCAYEWLIAQTKGKFDRDDAKRILTQTYSGTELVARPRRLSLMNLYLHGIHGNTYLGDAIYEPLKDERYNCILTNPPFGTKGANQAPTRDDFTIETSNKQLNFVQHVVNILKPDGRAAMVLPDTVLFDEHAARDVFDVLMEDCNLHTILRLPRGTFTPYSPGVKANVIFFTKGIKTENVWIYDARTNVPSITKEDRPLTPEHFIQFEECFGNDPNGVPRKRREEQERFKCFTREEIKKFGNNLHIYWLKDDSLEEMEDLADPEEIALEVSEQLKVAVGEIKEIIFSLKSSSNNISTIKVGNQLKSIVPMLWKFRYSVFAKAFSGELTNEWREQRNNLESGHILVENIKNERRRVLGKKYKEIGIADDAELVEIPSEWCWVRLGDLYDIVGGGTPSTRVPEYWNGKTPWITSADIFDLYDIQPRKFVSRRAITESAVNLVPPGSILIVTRVGLGKVAITKTELCFSQDVQALVNNEMMCEEYVLWCLSRAVQILKYSGRGATIDGLTKQQLRELYLPVPPFKEQIEIAHRIKLFVEKTDIIESVFQVK